MKLKPFQARVRVKNFEARLRRIAENNYSNPRFLTSDIRKLQFELTIIKELRELSKIHLK
jgi:hypothetical protein